MNRFITLMLRNILYWGCLLSFSVCAQEISTKSVIDAPIQENNKLWEGAKKAWRDDIQFHGFLSQGLFSTSGNNVYGKSKNSVSAGLTEVGLNLSYRALKNLSFAAQGLYRRAGAITGDAGKASLDFAFVDLNLVNLQGGHLGIRGGRIKNPWGLYNETRDVAFTHPTIFLPLTYFERSRKFMLSTNGGQLYANYNTLLGNLSFKFNYGWINANDKNILTAMINDPTASGHLKSKPSFVTQLNYEMMGGTYIFALSYADLHLKYQAKNVGDPYTKMKVGFEAFMVSGQYNGERLSFVAEYSLKWNKLTNIRTGVADVSSPTEYWYVQAGYRFLDAFQATLRYDSALQNINDKSGQVSHETTGLPAHLMFTQDVTFGVRWNITPTWMVRAEYHRMHGASTISLLDNPDFSKIAKNWNVYALQLAFRF